MTLKDTACGLCEFWSEFRKEKYGLVGLAILMMSLLVVAFEPLLVPFAEVNGKWRSIDYWIDNSSGAAPAWTNVFMRLKAPVTERIQAAKREETRLDSGAKMIVLEFPYRYSADKPPLDIIFHGIGTGDIPVTISVERPDGATIELASRYESDLKATDLRVSVEAEGKDATFSFLKNYASEEALQSMSNTTFRAADVIFNVARPGMSETFSPLKGQYKIIATVILTDVANFKLEKPYFVAVGSVSGLLGTDNMKRDIFSGLVAGLKWALLIGFLTSAVSVLIGVLYGIVSAYYGGIVDTIMQFIFQIVNSMPILPVLIVVTAVFRPSIWFIILAMVVFFWTGPVMTVRSMALQIKEETYIEAAKALGASHARIIWRHMMPILIPYSFASMALSVPSAIVYESSVSLLGLGDASIVTWGQILHDAALGGAVLNGVWWWIIPPGLLIAVMGMTFAFLGFAMDKILHPKLKTR
jgi:peptide/nickel transport system permease protein